MGGRGAELTGDIPMNNRAFIIAGDQAAVIANDIDDARYRAAVH